MAEEKMYPYAVARIRVLEKNLLTKQAMLQMAEAKSAEDCLRTVLEAGYEDVSNGGVREFEKILSCEMEKTYDVLKKLVPEEKFVNVFLCKNDYHNLKVLIKQEVSGIDGEQYLIDGGIIALDVLKRVMLDKSYTQLPKIMSQSIEEAFSLYTKTQNGQMIDIILDKGAFSQMKEDSEQSKNNFVIQYVTIVCDLTNLKSFLRVRNMKKGFDAFSNVFVKGGKIDLEAFSQAFASENPAQNFKATSYSQVCEDGMSKGFTVFEKLCDDYIMDFIKSAKYMPLTLEPLVAYLYAKESEIKTIRIIITSKINHIDADTIKERVRETYV